MGAAPADPARASIATRQRLIEAAGEAFAEKGFHHVTVRQICARAGTNLAAVNYHFGDKSGLYAAVLEFSLELAHLQYPMQPDKAVDAPTQLHTFIKHLLSKMLDDGRPSWHGRLMTREMVEPTDAFDMVVKAIRPNYATLVAIVSSLLSHGQRPEIMLAPYVAGENFGGVPELTRRICNSIIGQCVMYKHCEPLLRQLDLAPGLAPQSTAGMSPHPRSHTAQRHAAVESLAVHITDFSLAAIAGLSIPAQSETQGDAC